MDAQTLARAANLNPALASLWAPLLSAAWIPVQVITPLRQAMWIAQVGHESAGFSRLVESLHYTDAMRIWRTFQRFDSDRDREPDVVELARCHTLVGKPRELAIAAYGDRLGNRPGTDDGWTYRGRGLIQVTGRENYERCGTALGLDLLARPELLERHEHAVRSACWYWSSRGLNRLADVRALEQCTRAINGGLNGLADRRKRYQRALNALGV